MSLRSHLQQREVVEDVARQSWKFGRRAVIDRGLAYYDAHPADAERVRSGMRAMGLDASDAALGLTLEGIIAEKTGAKDVDAGKVADALDQILGVK